MTEKEAVVALNMLPRIGPVRVAKLLEKFGKASAVLGAAEDELLRVQGIGLETAGILHKWEDFCDLAGELAEAERRGFHVLTKSDEAYPSVLRDVYDAPLVLYVWGDLLERDRHAIGVVGSRRATMYGLNVTKKISFQLAHAGFTVISGLARGIDTAAHEAAMAAKGRTVAVIGSGLAKIFPAENVPLAERIASGNGAVVSEFSLFTEPDRQTFPQRNRIVAAWCRALLVTECPAWSGSLITANLATEYGRPVYAVPGPVDKPSSAGCHQLIREGATLVADGAHILDDFNELPLLDGERVVERMVDLPELSEEEGKIWEVLGDGERGVDEVIFLTGLPPAMVTSTLMKMDMKRVVRSLPGFRYARR